MFFFDFFGFGAAALDRSHARDRAVGMLQHLDHAAEDLAELRGDLRLGEGADPGGAERAQPVGIGPHLPEQMRRRLDQVVTELGLESLMERSIFALSGGEKQRISIARAMLKNAPIVLLDEATASVDPENEVYLQQAISTLVKDKTLIVIAHRLSTIRDAEQILVIDNGKLVQHGKHDELVLQEGIYQKYWNIRQNAKAWKVAQ